MTRYNTSFELSVEDMDLIETALRRAKHDLIGIEAKNPDEVAQPVDPVVRDIHDLLGRIHNQKVFYRPRKRPYIGG